MSIPMTYRADRYFINENHGYGLRSEHTVGPVRWWFARLQFWRFHRIRGAHVLRED